MPHRGGIPHFFNSPGLFTIRAGATPNEAVISSWAEIAESERGVGFSRMSPSPAKTPTLALDKTSGYSQDTLRLAVAVAAW